MGLRLALSIGLILLLLVFCGFVVVASRATYPEDQPPPTGICPSCHGKLLVHIYDGVGQENATDEFQGNAVRHCDLIVPMRSVWLFRGWQCPACGRTWPFPPSTLEKRAIPKPSAIERALFELGLWPSSSRRSRTIVLTLSAIFCSLASFSFLPPIRRAGEASSKSPIGWATAGALAPLVSMATAGPVAFMILFLADPVYHGRLWPRSDWECAGRLELCVLAGALGVLAVTALDEAAQDVRRKVAIGAMAGLAATAAQLIGILVAGLATEYYFDTRLHQNLVFPAMLSLYAFVLSWAWHRLPAGRHRWVGSWAGVAICAGIAWVSVRWLIPVYL